ncbi:bifunctional 3-(3-hydroxy-phenyl)propionate/3-hydroxycinnamic acid hydroxylase [Rhizorhabdus dicambivorans]|uniref:FAD-binding domain-containing protein n=1 Tax=Rhizorhabdus dicambivorans TaxID=1850238 RepID=A0A2A4FWM4_9SPHN|nr:bifunctional 3-(3-hydroxy-phenyl)propionate/3-hydroxycinnamic acid hydroxylase [Rhizorhabdus dicambivorans]ATE65494.1 hypothetical protein CMV14_14675 [Rhizorhabdus dicambivorans]PCE41838.1 hypothetical protein COO09_12435 [Rhizorhabdus dicambivorans]
MSQKFDVGVIGYGACGGVLVDLLLRSGLSVIVFDKWPDVLEIPRAAHIDDEIMRTFRDLGIVDDLPGTVIPSSDYSIYNALDQRVTGFAAIDPEPTDQGWLSDYFFVQPEIEHYLRAKARRNGATLKLGCEVVGLEEGRDGVVIDFRDAESGGDAPVEQVTVGYVVGADGANSFARQHIGSAWEQLAPSQRWMIVDIHVHDGVELDLSREAWTKVTAEETITYVPMPKNMQRFEFSMSEDRSDTEVKSDTAIADFVGKWFKPGDYEVLRAHVYHFHSRVAENWRKGRILLAGDAVHLAPPFLGQGVCSAIRDATNLAWKLARVVKGTSPDAILDSYQSERWPHAHMLVRIAGDVGEKLQWMATATEEELAAMKRQDYEHAQARPLMGPGLHPPFARAGGRLSPQPRLADGRLLDDHVGYRFALVGDPALIEELSPLTRASLEALDAVILADATDTVRDALTPLGGAAMLVRPDRYLVGVADSASEIDAIIAHVVEALRCAEPV